MKQKPASELQLSREDSLNTLTFSAFADGSVIATIQIGSGTTIPYPTTMGQSIQLRDFLNRHIDGLALAATGSLAVRSSDDPTQLASEEFIAAVQEGIADAEAGNLVSLNDVKGKWADRRHPDLVPGKVVDAPAGDLHLVWNPEKTQCVGFFDDADAEYTATHNYAPTILPGIGLALRSDVADNLGVTLAALTEELPRTKITFY